MFQRIYSIVLSKCTFIQLSIRTEKSWYTMDNWITRRAGITRVEKIVRHACGHQVCRISLYLDLENLRPTKKHWAFFALRSNYSQFHAPLISDLYYVCTYLVKEYGIIKISHLLMREANMKKVLKCESSQQLFFIKHTGT